MLTPADFGLIKNPFSIVPGVGVERWAGLPKTKESLADVVSSVRPDDIGASEFVVIYGKYGAGKTHALEYFAHHINNPPSDEKFPGRAIYMSEIVDGSGLSFSSLHQRILDNIEEEGVVVSLARAVKDSVQVAANQLSEQMKTDVTSDLAIQKAVLLPQDRAMVKSLNDTTSIPKPDKSDLASAKALSSLFRVMTSPIGNRAPCFGAVYLFLDEVETVLDVKVPLQQAFFGGLRALINEMPKNFGLVLSFTEELAVLESALPRFLQERRTRPNIECENLQTDGAKNFVREYLEGVRPDGYSPPQPFYPFKEEAIDAIFEHENTALVPRRMIRSMLRVWERVSREGILPPGEEITREMADDVLQQFNL